MLISRFIHSNTIVSPISHIQLQFSSNPPLFQCKEELPVLDLAERSWLGMNYSSWYYDLTPAVEWSSPNTDTGLDSAYILARSNMEHGYDMTHKQRNRKEREREKFDIDD